MRFENDRIGFINADALLDEIRTWQDELFVDSIEDEIIYNTLDSVIDLIVNV